MWRGASLTVWVAGLLVAPIVVSGRADLLRRLRRHTDIDAGQCECSTVN